MARLSRLELFQNAVLPKLADGPKSQLQLDVPRYALEALQDEGLVRMRTQKYWTTTGRGGIQMWFLPQHEPPPLRDCAVMTFEGLDAEEFFMNFSLLKRNGRRNLHP